MRAWVETHGKGLRSGDYYTVKAGAGPRCLLMDPDTTVCTEVEDPGWPDGSDVLVVGLLPDKRQALLELQAEDKEESDEDTVWVEPQGFMHLCARRLRRWLDENYGMYEEESIMNGNVYEGVVVRTERVAAGPNSDKDKSEVVYVSKPFVARDDATASGIVLAQAVADQKVDPNDVEVRVRKF